MTFTQTLTHHLEAIQNRDLNTFASTLSNSDDLTIILPNGSMIQGFDAVVDFHRNWFADDDWSMNLELVKQWQTSDMGTAIYKVAYHDLDPDGTPYQLAYLLTLIFANEGDEWRLVHDQNTMCSEA